MSTILDEPTLATIAANDRIFEKQRQNRDSVARATARERRAKLKRLHDALFAARDEIRAAMWEDLRKPASEADLSELWVTVSEIRHAMRNLRRWMAPHRVPTRLALFGARSEVRYEPKGVILVIAPWNFPFMLALAPAVSAIAAGNCVVIKPSELTPHSAASIARIIGRVFEESEVAVVTGGKEVAEDLVRRKFDHIFFTGSTAVGRSVMMAAAENLVPVTLELGGKSPTIVDESADVRSTARKIAWGKWFNAGQICVAPDYLLVHSSRRDALVAELQKTSRELWNAETRGTADRTAIVNERHLDRLRSLLDDAVAKGAKVVAGGRVEQERWIEPTLLTGVRPDMEVMRQEIFGPLLPIVTFERIEEAIEMVRSGEKPLALYVFSENRKNIDRVIRETTAGTTAINDTVIQFIEPHLPFGGTGSSGFGRGHGFDGFVEFSNVRSILRQPFRRTLGALLYPPYRKQKLIDLIVRWL